MIQPIMKDVLFLGQKSETPNEDEGYIREIAMVRE